MTLGQNGIIAKTYEAKNKTEESQKNEQEAMNILNNILDDYIANEDNNASITLDTIETSSPAGEDGYSLGENIVYMATIQNNGSLPLKDIVLTCEMRRPDGTTFSTGDEFTIDKMEVGKALNFNFSYTVSEADLQGELENICKVSAVIDDGSEKVLNEEKVVVVNTETVNVEE